MRIIVITDVHANLPALEAALESIRAEGYDALFHTGDTIGIGPYPAECLELLLNTPNIHFVMGNHESYFEDSLLRRVLPAQSPSSNLDRGFGPFFASHFHACVVC